MKTIFLKTFFSVVMTTTILLSSLQAAEWYKGQLHMHSLWSDGNVLPEQAIAWYKDRGFHFVCLSDHSILQLDPDRWIEITDNDRARIVGGRGQEVPRAHVNISKERFGADWVETKTEDGKNFVRLKTFAELAEKMNEEGKFLLIPGHEQNARIARQPHDVVLHSNAMNITETIPFPNQFSTVHEAATSWLKASLANSAQNGLEGLWMLNHPYWPYYDILPEVLIKASDIEFFENRNVSAGPEQPHPEMPDEEKYWDIISSFRILNGHRPIYGVATDDTHDYLTFREQHSAIPGEGWIVVRAEKLEANALVRAMRKGDFYGSTGVVLRDIRFDPAARTLTVEVDPAEGVEYTVRFVGTKRGFDTSRRSIDLPEAGRLSARPGWAYSDQIGVTLQTSVGNSATYRMAPDDLYVRAIVTSNRRLPFESVNKPDYETAWTQPVGW